MSDGSLSSVVVDRFTRLRAGSSGWELALIALAVGLPTILAVYWEAASAAIHTWRSTETFGHGFLIVPISGWLIWRERRRLLAARPRPCPWAIPLAVVFSVGWVLSRAAEVVVLQQFVLVAVVLAFCLAVLGWAATRTIGFALLFLVFAVPFGDFLILPLQELTAHMLVPLVRWSGIPVYFQGLHFEIPSARFEVAEACSGIRYLISLTVLGVLSSYIFLVSFWRRVALVALFIAVSILANSLRAYGIVMIAHLSGLEYAVGTDHILYGWLFFSIVSLGLLAITWKLREQPVGSAAPPIREGAGGDLVAAPSIRHVMTGGLALAAIAMGPVAFSLLARANWECMPGDFAGPSVGHSWSATATAAGDWKPLFEGASRETRLTYRARDGRDVLYYAAYYLEERQGAELINHANRIFDPKEWHLIGSDYAVAENGGSRFRALTRRLQSATASRVVWYSFWVGGEFTTNPLTAKLLQAKAALLRSHGGSAVIAIAASYEDEPSNAAQILRELLSSAEPLGEMLDRQLARPAQGTYGPSLQHCN